MFLRKIISFALCIVMCVTIFSTNITVFAAGTAKTFLDVSDSGMQNGEITFTIKLKPGLTRVSGAILNIDFDSDVLEIKSAEPVFTIDKDGNQINNVAGEYISGFVKNQKNLYSVAFMNTNGVTTGSSEYKSFFNVTFKVIAKERPTTTVKFICKEFFTNDDVSNDIRQSDSDQNFKDVTFSTLDNPKLIQAKLQEDGIVFTWSAVDGAEEYSVLRKASDEGIWRTVAEVSEEVTSYTDKNVESGITYTYSVKSGNGYGDSGYYSAGISQLYLTAASITSISNLSNAVKLMWAPVSGAENYAVYRQESGSSEWKLLEKTASARLYYEDSTVESNNVYKYCVVAESGDVSSIIGVNSKTHKFLAAPTIKEGKNIEDGIRISWNSVTGAEKYELYRKSNANDNWNLYLTTYDTEFIDKDIVIGTSYLYALKTLGQDVTSNMSTAISVSRVIAPESMDFEYNDEGIKISWSKVPVAQGYNIYRKSRTENEWQCVGNVGATITDYKDSSAVGGYYTYGVTATLEKSESVMTTKDKEIYFLGSPKNLILKNVSEGIEISWDTVPNATGYIVSRRDAVTGEVKNVTESKTTSYVDKSVVNLNSYAYTVIAVDENGEKSKGNAYTVDFCWVTSPIVLNATPAIKVITVSWKAISGVDSYYVYRKTDGGWIKIGEAKASDTSFNDVTVKSGVQYKYTVTAVKNNSESYLSDDNYKSATYVTKPSNITASLTGDGISLNWTVTDEFSNFILYKREKGTSSFKELAKVSSSTTTYHDTAVTSGVVYEYALKAISGDGTYESALSDITAVPFLSKIETVTVSSYAGGVKISWSKVEGAEEYIVYRRLSTGSWETLKTVSASTTSYKDTTAESGKNYYYTVRATSDGYRSAYQNYEHYYLATPKVSKFDSQVDKGITVKWNAVSGAEKYYVYRKTGDSSWKKIATTENLRYVDKDIKFGKTYYYTLKAVGNGITTKCYSDGWKCKYAPGTPTISSVSATSSSITVKWNEVSGIDGYKVYRKVEGEKKYTSIAKVKGTSYTDKNVKKGVKYLYTVKAYKGNVVSGCKTSKSYMAVVLETPKATVSNTTSGVKISWAKISGAEQYKIYRSQYDASKGKWTSYKRVKTLDAKNLTWTDGKATSGEKYKYKVKAYSVNSKSSTKATSAIIYLASTKVTIKNTEKGINLSWTKVEGAERYRVYRSEYNKSTGKWNSYETMTTVSAKTLSWTDTTVKEGNTYKYRVRAIKEKTLSSYKTTGKIECSK